MFASAIALAVVMTALGQTSSGGNRTVRDGVYSEEREMKSGKD